MSKHTPGPWSVWPEEVDKPYIRVRGTAVGGRFKIANVLTPIYEGVAQREAEQTRANARLIAAAPELLAMLTEAAGVLEHCRYSELPMAKKCRDLIERCTTRSGP